MPKLTELSTFTSDGDVRVVVEAPRGAKAKFKYDEHTETFTLAHSFLAGLSYPYDWGFIPSTCAEDGDPIDVLVLHDVSTYPGMTLACSLVGVLELKQREGKKKAQRNDRLLAVPVKSHRAEEIAHIDDVTKRLRHELEQFFVATDALEQKELEFLGWKGPRQAKRLLLAACKAYGKK